MPQSEMNMTLEHFRISLYHSTRPEIKYFNTLSDTECIRYSEKCSSDVDDLARRDVLCYAIASGSVVAGGSATWPLGHTINPTA